MSINSLSLNMAAKQAEFAAKFQTRIAERLQVAADKRTEKQAAMQERMSRMQDKLSARLTAPLNASAQTKNGLGNGHALLVPKLPTYVTLLQGMETPSNKEATLADTPTTTSASQIVTETTATEETPNQDALSAFLEQKKQEYREAGDKTPTEWMISLDGSVRYNPEEVRARVGNPFVYQVTAPTDRILRQMNVVQESNHMLGGNTEDTRAQNIKSFATENIVHELNMIKQNSEQNGTVNEAKALFVEYTKFKTGTALNLDELYQMFGVSSTGDAPAVAGNGTAVPAGASAEPTDTAVTSRQTKQEFIDEMSVKYQEAGDAMPVQYATRYDGTRVYATGNQFVKIIASKADDIMKQLGNLSDADDILRSKPDDVIGTGIKQSASENIRQDLQRIRQLTEPYGLEDAAKSFFAEYTEFVKA